MGNKSWGRVFCGRCRWFDNRAWCRFTHYRRSPLRTRRSFEDGYGKCVGMVHIRSPSASSTRRSHRCCHDKMVRRRLNRAFNGSSNERSDGGQVGNSRFSSDHGRRPTSMARILEKRPIRSGQSLITHGKMERTVATTAHI